MDRNDVADILVAATGAAAFYVLAFCGLLLLAGYPDPGCP